MRSPLVRAVLATLVLTASPAGAAIVTEIFTDRAAFEARLGGAAAVRIVDFDDIDTATVDPVPFAPNRYKSSKGVVITGEGGQFASRHFDVPSNMPPLSAPNEYAPGPISDVFGEGGNDTDVTFFTGVQPAKVAGVGVVFVDPDFPGDGPSSLAAFDDGGIQLGTTGTVSGGDGSQLFRGIVSVDTSNDQPVAAIARAHVVSGQGWAGNNDNETVALDDLEFALPAPGGNLGEACDNCVDDDGDGFEDRLDGECAPPADGGGQGLGDPLRAKALVACGKAIAGAGAKFVAAKAKQLQGCLGLVLSCVQLKPGDPACLPKAEAKCAAAKTKIAGLETKLTDGIAKKCGGVTIADLTDPRGLGYAAETADCVARGVAALASPADVGLCVMRQHECRAEELVYHENARARELAQLGGLSLVDFPCLDDGGPVPGGGLPDPASAKAAVKCQKALDKSGAKFAQQRQKAIHKCIDGVLACAELKPTDAACVPKANAKCTKVAAALTPASAPKSLAGKLRGSIVKACGGLAIADLTATNGLGQSARLARCQEIGIASLASASDVADCLAAFHACRVDAVLETQSPRLRELLEAGGLAP